jgi:tetratricopeptide (TPR) repeat protein
MNPRLHVRCLPAFFTCAIILAISACRTNEEPAASGPPPAHAGPQPSPAELKDEIPAAALGAVLAAHFKGAGLMEQYQYNKAADAFREVRSRAPGWIAGSINLAIALLNSTGEKIEVSKAAGGGAEVGNFDEALQLLEDVLKRDPDNRHAHYCTGIILEQQGALVEAHKHFRRVTELDPHDATSWYWAASTLTDPENPTLSTSPALAKEQAALFTRALDLDPYLVQAIYKLAFVSRLAGEPAKQKRLLDRWNKLNPDRQQPVPGPGNSAAKSYGEMGKYATVIGPDALPTPAEGSAPLPPRFEPARPLNVKLQPGDRWATADDFQGDHALIGRVRARFGAAAATFDANGDGKLDIYVAAAVVGPGGLRDALLINKGDGHFEDSTAALGLPLHQASLGVAAADFDADRQVDIFLTGVGKNRLLHNRDGKSFEDLTSMLKSAQPPAVSLQARWLDLDQDGDLDLYVVNYCSKENAEKAFLPDQPPPPGVACSVYRNDGQPEPIPGSPEPVWAPLAVAWENVRAKRGLSLALVPWTDAPHLLGQEIPHTGIAALDIDDDRDLDLVLTADGAPPVAVLNDRLGNFHDVVLKDLAPLDQVSGLLAMDLDQDGRCDLVAPSHRGRVQALRNSTQKSAADQTLIRFEPYPTSANAWCSATAADLDLDGRPDLVGLLARGTRPAGRSSSLEWARNDGKRLGALELPLALETPGVEGFALADLIGDPLLDLLIVRAGAAPALAPNTGNGHHFLALQLGGHWRAGKEDKMRTNSHALGARVRIEGQGIQVAYEHTTPSSGLAQSIGPVILGLGNRDIADLVHLRWPDGVMQCELNVAADQKVVLAENNRRISSCPVLFTWNGDRFVCVGDFLGGGGLGYLVAPGVYGRPDRDEALAIAPELLRAEQGVFRLSVSEPMDEVAYLDYLALEVIDRPPGVSVTPDERFAPSGPRPTGQLIAWRQTVFPEHASDLTGRDMTETLRRWDRRTVDTFRKLNEWIGYAEEHGIILDFGDRLSQYGASEPLVLCLAGWVEYPYSQTNYAAGTAGVALAPPVIERRRGDGTWEMIEPHAGYPAGMPRLTTLELTGKLSGSRCVLRIRTNMECYFDQAFVAVRDRQAETALRVTALPVARAALGHRGYSREVSPDGRAPLLYDYDHVDPAPLARLSGKLTRYGDVARLLQTDDDRFCVMGPGDEARLEFDAAPLPPLPAGWTRGYVLRAGGYCKDADPFTATSDTVDPLPWRNMPSFPFGPGVVRPADPSFEAYLREYQTRPAGGGERPSEGR